MRSCPFNGCDVALPDSLFACKRHWYSLSLKERTEIYQAYDDYMDDRIGMDALRMIQQKVLGGRGTA